jgi:hypothetical protein
VSGAKSTGCHNPALPGSPFAALVSVQDVVDLGPSSECLVKRFFEQHAITIEDAMMVDHLAVVA